MIVGAYAGDGHERGLAPPRSLLPVVVCFVLLALYMAWMIAMGSPLNGDADDMVKLHELRTFMATGNLFDRTLPGILQPEPYVSHWPWIVDLPYALVAWPLSPFLGFEAALVLACYAVPIILLAPTLYCYHRLLTAAGGNGAILPLFIAVVVAAASLFEFAPRRVDYHNLEILLFFIALLLTLSRHRHAASGNGLVVALALAISFEFAAFHALIMAIYAFDFVFGDDAGRLAMRRFGAGLAAGALFLLVVIVPPAAYGAGRCDSYSAPYALALMLAGATFVALSAQRVGRWRPSARVVMLFVLAVASIALVLALYPQCVGGPYGELSARLREVALASIPQEKSLLLRADFVLSGSLPALALLFVGALAPAMLCLLQRQPKRPLVVIALACVVASALTVAYFRYLRYLPLFSGLGLVFVVAAALPAGARHILLATPLPGRGPWLAAVLMVPGLVITAVVAAFCLVARPAAMPTTAFDLAGFCDAAPASKLRWPQGAVVLSPPGLGAHMMAQSVRPAVVAVPNHPAAQGIERTDRFLDPGSADPRTVLAESRASHVVVCAAPPRLDADLRDRFPFTVALMEGRPPSWLAQCPMVPGTPLRIYSFPNIDRPAACPTP